MPAHKVDGKSFGRLTVKGRDITNTKKGSLIWLCQCLCGNVTRANASQLINGRKLSCGCLRREATKIRRTTHGASGTKTFNAWCAMRKRCDDSLNENYGGRGIGYAKRWMLFSAFLEDMGEAPAGLTLERVDVNGDYEPGNCIWADQKTQNRNKRRTIKVEIDGEIKSLSEWCEFLGLNHGVIYSRINRGATPIDALRLGGK